MPVLASARLQRWSLILGAYSYKIKYKPGQHHSNADALSRLPLPKSPTSIPTPGETIHLIENMRETPVDWRQIATWTSRDPELSRVHHFVLQGWPENAEEEELRVYHRRELELSVHGGCVLWGNRVVIPKQGREIMLTTLHEGHPGISRMKAIARSFLWWPGLDREIEETVRGCWKCQQVRHTPPQTPMASWTWPSEPWQRLHIDYAGPFHGKMFLIVVDAHSKWMEVCVVNSATSRITVDKLRTMFATHGLPETLVSDNGAVFTSEEFREFVQKNGIKHIRIAPYHPASNGQAERAVQVLKEGIKKCSSADKLETQVARILFSYRTTPHTTTGVMPAELLMGRQLRSHLSLIQPSVTARVEKKQEQQRAKRE